MPRLFTADSEGAGGGGNGVAAPPAVTVIIATYNRSQPLCHAIRSVLAQTYTDWELIVAGDACTDDTESCVAAFGDKRIRFVNLPERHGYQSGPCNHALTLARGSIVAFLNHDDLFFPDHLAVCVAELEKSGADLVWVPTATALPRVAARLADRPCAFELTGIPQSEEYWPGVFYFASSWVFRGSLADRVGPWVPPDQTYLLPSQEWLFRAWRRGAVMKFVWRLTVMTISPGNVAASYGRRECPEHDILVKWMQDDPRCREKILEEQAIGEAMARLRERFHPGWGALRRFLLRPVYRILPAMGIHPQSISGAIRRVLRGVRRGDGVRLHSKTHGADSGPQIVAKSGE